MFREFEPAGFLTYKQEAAATVDVVTTRSALHQLPDTWKQVALNNTPLRSSPVERSACGT